VLLAGRDATAEFGFGADMVLISAPFLLIRSLILPWTALAEGISRCVSNSLVLNRKVHRPQMHRRDRFFWAPLPTMD
jgi:hypothetical protein